jgi:hypothetical protein
MTTHDELVKEAKDKIQELFRKNPTAMFSPDDIGKDWPFLPATIETALRQLDAERRVLKVGAPPNVRYGFKAES